MRNIARGGGREGFSLPEVLVAVAMSGILAAVVLPSVIGQISKSEVSRVVQDLQAVEQAATMFRADVGFWPGDLADLVVAPQDTMLDLKADDYGDAVDDWRGPYLARGEAEELPTGMAGTITRIADMAWDNGTGEHFVTVVADGFSSESATLISLSIDGEENLELTNEAAGKVRWEDTASGTLYYFAVPTK